MTDSKIVREIFAAINRDDIPAALKFFDPNAVRIEPESFSSSGTYCGLAEILDLWTQARNSWAEGSCEPEKIIVAGDKVIALLHVRVRLKNKPEWNEGRIAEVFTFRNGKVIEMRFFVESQTALEWAGC